MARIKHLFVIHGRSTKPSQKEKTRIVTQSLRHGISRVQPDAVRRVGQRAGADRVKFTFVYYGDISNQLILERDPSKAARLTGRDSVHNNGHCEPDHYYDAWLENLFAQKAHGKAAYKRFLKAHPDRGWVDDVASVVSAAASLTHLSDNLISKATADMGAYLLTRRWGSQIRDRLQRPLKKSLLAGEDICLVAHSMGCIVSYDVLWKFSRMSEYRDVQNAGNRVSKWLTLGNPLGEPGVRDNLYDADERDDGRYPSGIIKDWINVSAEDDFICHDPTVRNDFREMERANHLDRIVDKKIYNFWLGEKRTNPHKFYGYLDNPTVAGEIVDWMNAP